MCHYNRRKFTKQFQGIGPKRILPKFIANLLLSLKYVILKLF